jgi:hypothetical protein
MLHYDKMYLKSRFASYSVTALDKFCANVAVMAMKIGDFCIGNIFLLICINCEFEACHRFQILFTTDC